MYLLVNGECVSALADFLRSNELNAADDLRVRSMVAGERIVIGQCDTIECVDCVVCNTRGERANGKTCEVCGGAGWVRFCKRCGDPTYSEASLCGECETDERDAAEFERLAHNALHRGLGVGL